MAKGSYTINSYSGDIGKYGGVDNRAYHPSHGDFDTDIPHKEIDKETSTSTTTAATTTAEENEEEGEERQQWDRPIEFLLSCVAMSVGLGNVWRFPTTAYENGGGAFLIPYLLVLTFIGRPLYFLELVLGQFSSSGSVKVWRMVPAAKGVGYAQLLATYAVVTYYTSLMALTIFYFIMSFNGVLPWSQCSPPWADEYCVDADSVNASTSNMSQSSSEQYFYKHVLNIKTDISDGIGIPDWRLSLCLLFSWAVIFLVMAKGGPVIRQGEACMGSGFGASYFMALFPYVVLFTLLIRGVTLPGATNGMLYFITPVWHKLLDPNVWYAAVTQCFFSLSVGYGAIITFASYNKFEQNVYRDAWIISFADTFTSLLAGLTIFSILGNLAYQLDTDIEDVVRGGSGLAFISYPDALAKFTWAPQVFAVLFFLMLFTLGCGSVAGLSGSIITVICDKLPTLDKLYVTLFVCISGFLVGLLYVTPGGQLILELVDFFGGGFIIFILVIVETVAAVLVYGPRNLLGDIKFMLDVDLGIYWKFSWFFFIPVALTCILVYSLVDLKLPKFNGVPYPEVAYVCGWLLAGVAVSLVPIFFVETFTKTKGDTFEERLQATFRPKESWGPKKKDNRERWEQMKKEQNR
ncbi:hypothetical protein Pmani_039485 [Petrolisthes manimaculis]|uniref:Sodium-dependent nutrient amino acid transporter 1 n=1 Tax=Petrolisthes manimaculis TaxID=1843537 RepID=A0AAE1NDK5_9EUCA|nr:hypothetical protein Pmani_039485 [Petrolisthes manimaculis]